VITSTPPPAAASGLPFQYQVHAQDPEGDPLTYSLVTAPDGMTINPGSGLVNWIGAPIGPGLPAGYAVSIQVSDGRGGQDSQSFTLFVTAATANLPPQITSTNPPTSVALGHDFLYAVLATDPNSDPLTYSLTTAPEGMTIDAGGLIRWTPTADQFGPNPVTVRVGDGRGGTIQQSFTVNVITQPTGQPPVITSTTPPAGAVVDHLYAYDPVASDPDGTPLVWNLDAAPVGMSIDQTQGNIRWVPTADQLGSQDVVIRVTNSEGHAVTQSFTISVHAADTPPMISSLTPPPSQAAAGQLYSYAVQASDVDGDLLTYSLTTAPTGMTINASTGLIQWTPTAGQVGTQSISLLVADGQGGTATESWQVAVAPAPANQPPGITSTAPQSATVGQLYQYAVTATDPDGPAPSFSLKTFPTGMVIDPASGLVQWVPSGSQVGAAHVTVAATDAHGAAAQQNFTITVTINHPPTISSTPPGSVTVGLTYRYDVHASDPDGDALTYALSSGPSGTTLDAMGRLTWSPTLADVGTAHPKVTVADSRGLSISQSFSVVVVPDTQAPKVSLQILGLAAGSSTANLGSDVTFVVTATDNVAAASFNLTVSGTHVALDSGGQATVRLTTPGTFQIVATATDPAGNTGTTSASLSVVDPTVTSAPVVSFDSPTDGDILTGPTNVIGSIADPHLLSYTLSVHPFGSASFTQIASGTTPVTHGLLGQFDPSLLPNDNYVLRLDAKNTGGLETVVDAFVSVSGNFKLGNFTLSFTDLTIPVAGVPITVGRTYDTLNSSTSEDFGFGWKLEFRDVDLRTDVAKTYDEQDLIYNPFQDGTRVFVTLPGGRREGFTFHVNPAPGLKGGFLGILYPSFTPDAGVTDQLSVPQTDLRIDDQGNVRGWEDGIPYNFASALFNGPLVLTTKDGFAYDIDASSGLLSSVTDTHGNTLTFSDSGIVSSAGPRVTFERDPQNRIVAVIDPSGQKITYQYDAAGNLTSVTDRAGNTTQFQYTAPRPHYLTKVIDPLGHTGLRADYDDQGRLVSLTDATGQTSQMIYDPTHSTETVYDQLGNPTTYVYDDRGNIVTEVDASGGVSQRTFDAAGNLLTETDPLGRTTTFTYDASGNRLTQTDPLGNVTRYTYQSIPRQAGLGFSLPPLSVQATLTDPVGNVTKNTYDAQGSPLSTIDALGHVTYFTYNAAGNPTSVKDANGSTILFTYDSAGHAISETDALANVTSYTYDANGNQLTETTKLTTPLGERTLVTTYAYDADGRLISVTDPEGGVTKTEYDAAGNMTATVDALGRRTEYQYDDRGELVGTTNPDGTTTAIEYDAAGHKTADIDEAGRRTTYKYDVLGRLIETDYPDATPNDPTDNPRTKIEYDAAGEVTAQVDERGNRTEFTYDKDGRQTSIKDALGNVTSFAYDAAGQLVSQTDALGHTTRFVFDAAGRLVETDYPDGSKSTATFDPAGRVTARTDQAGLSTHYEYDKVGRLTAVVDALGQRTSYAYDEAGDLVSQTDANGKITRYEYDGLGRRTATVLPLGERSTTAYDKDGEVLSTTDYNGTTINRQYDSRGRLTEEDFADGTSIKFTYTPTGQRQTVTDASGVTRYTYDARDELLSRTDPDGTQISYTYDTAGNRISVTTPAGTATYSFDALNRVATVTDPNAGVTSYTYDAAGNLTHTTMPNGTSETRQYDSLNQLVYLENDGPTGVISSFRYTLDADGNRTKVVENTGRTVLYAYDALARLTSESITDAALGNRMITYTYDAVGNRLSLNDSATGLTSYTYDSNDRLLTETLAGQTTIYNYDDNGNMLSKVTSAIDQVLYQWDARNVLIEAVLTDGSGTHRTDYGYNADGIRVSQTADGAETRYLLDTVRPYPQVLLEYRPSGPVLASYVYGNGLIEQKRGGVLSYYHVDGLGSTRALSSSSGAVTDRYVYDASGRMLGQTGNTINTYLFAGQQRDSRLGLDYLRARYFQPSTGRFLGRDPLSGILALPITQHPYLYAGANPVNLTDPTGRQFDLGGLSAAVSVQSILCSISFTHFLFAALTITVIVKVMGPGFAGRNLALELISSSTDSAVLDRAYELYRRSGELIALGAGLIEVNSKVTSWAQSVVGLGGAIRELAVASGNVQAIARALELANDTREVVENSESLIEAIEHLEHGGGSSEASSDSSSLVGILEAIAELALGILGEVE
jgi:large repetitive protein